MLSYFLTWLSDRDVSSNASSRTFVMVTMNRVTGLPPELLRAGRFDRVWSTDLPDVEERDQILRIHLSKRGVDPTKYSAKALKGFCGAMDGYSGAEIEEVVRSARCNSYDAAMTSWETAGKAGSPPTREQCEPSHEQLMAAVKEIKPLSVLAAEEIAKTRKFCAERASPVNGNRVQQEPKQGGRKVNVPTDASNN